MAIAIMETIRANKLRVPEDISVTGFDDDPDAAESFPTLTTAHQPMGEMGELGARKLLYAINAKTVPKGSTLMEPSLIIRASTAAPPKSSSLVAGGKKKRRRYSRD